VSKNALAHAAGAVQSHRDRAGRACERAHPHNPAATGREELLQLARRGDPSKQPRRAFFRSQAPSWCASSADGAQRRNPPPVGRSSRSSVTTPAEAIRLATAARGERRIALAANLRRRTGSSRSRTPSRQRGRRDGAARSASRDPRTRVPALQDPGLALRFHDHPRALLFRRALALRPKQARQGARPREEAGSRAFLDLMGNAALFERPHPALAQHENAMPRRLAKRRPSRRRRRRSEDGAAPPPPPGGA